MGYTYKRASKNDNACSGLVCGPELCIGDEVLGFWKALSKVYGKSYHQRCWVHKQANVLNKMPQSLQEQAKKGLHDIWMKADTKEEAEKAFNKFCRLYEDKYPKATECLQKDLTELLTFFDSSSTLAINSHDESY